MSDNLKEIRRKRLTLIHDSGLTTIAVDSDNLIRHLVIPSGHIISLDHVSGTFTVKANAKRN